MSNKKDCSSSSGASSKDERKLKPIFDLVDEGNYKQAIVQLDKFLKRNQNNGRPSSQISGAASQSLAAVHQAKALKCLCLWKLPGRQAEASQQVDLLLEEEPDDEGALSVFSLCLRDMQKDTEMEQLYVKAVNKHPKNEDLMSCLFMAHVRTDNFKMQQQRALQLNKLTSSPNSSNTHKPYYFWAVMSLVLQSDKDANGLKVQLPLARKMMEKSVNDSLKDIVAGEVKFEQIDLLLMILEKQQDFPCAYHHFTKHIAVYDKELPILRDRRRVEYLTKMGNLEKVENVCKEIIISTGEAADWYFMENLITCVNKKIDTKCCDFASNNGSIRTTLADLVNFLNEEKRKHCRSIGHHFSLLFLRNLIDSQNVALSESCPDNLQDMKTLMFSFFEKFGQKSPFFSYVRPCVTVDVCTSFVNELTSKLSLLENGSCNEAPDLNKMYKLMAVCEVERYLTRFTLTLTVESCEARSNTLMRLFDRFLPLGRDLKTTEPQFSTKFLILSAHYLIDAYMLTEGQCQRYLWLALDRLTEASSGKNAHSPLDSQILLVILRIYHHLGLIVSCAELMDKMQIKQFIMQTTGWLISNRLVSCGAFEEAHLFHSTIMKYVQNSIQTVPDFLIQAYRNGAFRKVCDMLQWKQTLVKSYTFIKCVVEETVLDFATEINSAKTFECKINELSELLSDYDRVMIEWEQWVDDRDLDLQYNWEIEDYDWTSKQARALSFNLDICWLKIRYTLICQLSALSCCVCTSINFTTTDALFVMVSQMASDQQKALAEGFPIVEQVTSTKMFEYFRNHPFSPFSSPVVQFYSMKMDSFYQNLSIVISVICNDLNASHCQKQQENPFNDLMGSIQCFRDYIETSNKKETFLVCCESNRLNAEDLMSLQLIFEAASICSVVLDNFSRLKRSSNKRPKSPESRQGQFANFDLKSLHAALSEVFVKMESRLDELLTKIFSTEWNLQYQTDLVRTNFCSTLNQLKTFCKAKTKYLQNLKF